MMNFLEDDLKQAIEHDLTPLINIIFLMLIYFMLAAAIAPPEDATVQPVLSSSDGLLPDNNAVVITINAKSELFVDGVVLSVDELGQQLQLLGANAEPVVISIKSDAELDADVLIDVLAQATDAGIESAALMSIRR